MLWSQQLYRERISCTQSRNAYLLCSGDEKCPLRKGRKSSPHHDAFKACRPQASSTTKTERGKKGAALFVPLLEQLHGWMGIKVVLVQVVVGPWLLWARRPIWGNGHCGIKEETSALMQAWGHSHPLSHLSSVCGPFSLCCSPGHRITGSAIISTIQSAPFMWEIRPRELPSPALHHKVPLLSDNTASLISLHVWLRPWCPVWILKTKQNAHISAGDLWTVVDTVKIWKDTSTPCFFRETGSWRCAWGRGLMIRLAHKMRRCTILGLRERDKINAILEIFNY